MMISPKTRNRDSNLELLRIVCMLFILMHHFIVHVFYPNLALHDGNLGWYRVISIVINGFAYVGVNCFILISGYYGIKFKWKSIFNLYCLCAFYALLVVVERCICHDIPFDKGMLYAVILPFSHSEWWFITCYSALFMLSPILNKAIEGFGRKEFVLAIVLLTIVNLYFGYYWHLHNVDGYNLLQFVFVYFIGAFLHKFPLKGLDRRMSLALYLTCVALWSIITIISVKWRIPHWSSFQYNNPIVILSSVGLFVYMTTFEIRSHKINALASGVLAAYLIQDVQCGLICSFSNIYKENITMSCNMESMKILSMFGFVVLGSVVVLIIALAIDKVRSVLMIPVWKVYGKVRLKIGKMNN